MHERDRYLFVMFITHTVLGDAQRPTPCIGEGTFHPLDYLGLIKYD